MTSDEELLAALGPAERKALLEPSDLRGALAVGGDWALVAAALAAVGTWPNVATLAGALVIVGGRQLAFAILMHEAAHRTLFRTRALNDLVGEWLCAGPVWADLRRYRKHHLAHHAFTGTAKDPDLCLVTPFPTSRASLLRKVARDLTGLAGLRRLVATFLMDTERLSYTASGGARRLGPGDRAPGVWRRGLRRLAPFATSQLLVLAVCWAFGKPWLYAVWFAALLTTYSLFLRFRAIAEHSCTGEGPEALPSTRTTEAGLLARLTVAPHGVNYHLEHHALMSVPFFRLRALHERLRARGALAGAHVAPSYRAVLRRVVTARTAAG
ncbi:MAG: fatty acid desaturase family protein [Myxococcota bacterium]